MITIFHIINLLILDIELRLVIMLNQSKRKNMQFYDFLNIIVFKFILCIYNYQSLVFDL
jgi:hypothetical protein